MGNACVSGTIDIAPPDFIIYVKTGDKKGAGTNADVYIALFNIDGTRSRDIELNAKWRDDFEAGRMDNFPVENLPNFGEVTKIEIWRSDDGVSDDWFVERIDVEDVSAKTRVVFPVHRWVKAEKKVKLKAYDSILPQDDDDSDLRKIELQEKKCLYDFHCKEDGLIPQCKDFPPDESFSNDYKWDIIQNKASLILESKILKMTREDWDTLHDIEDLYNDKLPVPYGMKNWREDKEFGAQRLSGCNATVIRLCRSIPNNFPVTNEMLQSLLGDMTIEEAIQKKKLYILDYTFLRDLPCTNDRKICAALALFFMNKDQDLMPVAIQLQPDPADDNPIFLPTDPEYTWLLAKLWFNNVDASYHQSCTHLAFTHLVMETVAVATHRCLSPSHPLFRLLAPHFLYLIAINTRALSKLVSEGGWIDKCMGIGRIGMFEIIRRSWKTWRLDVQGNLPKDLEFRGVADPEALPHYYYRDDAMLLWEATKNYVTTVVEGHYDEEKLAKDEEVQDWANVLTSSSCGCGIQGVPGDGKFSTCEQLIDTVTSFIFISSTSHAAANFSQYDEYAFPPNYPAFLKGSPPNDKTTPHTDKEILNILPNKEMTLSIMVVTKLLSDRGTNGLGDFEIDYQFDSIGTSAVEQFRKELKEIGVIIDERNAKRTPLYDYLHPKEVPNAISI